MIRINLPLEHQLLAAKGGLFRAENYIPQWTKQAHSFPKKKQYGELTFPELVLRQTEAFAAECAVAQYLKQPLPEWDNRNYKIKADVGRDIEVKWAKYENSPLIIQTWDRDDDVAILVVGKSPCYYLVGWLPVAVAKQPKYRHDQQGNYWVTQINLQPMENLERSNYGTHRL
jgi:hypothetical protein